MDFPLANIFLIFGLIMIYGISFILSYVFYAYMINKSEKKFVLTAYSKWSIIVTNTISFGFPFLLILDHFKNNYMAFAKLYIKDFLYYLLMFCVILFVNNMVIKYVYETKFIRKLSDKMKSIGKSNNLKSAELSYSY